MSINPAIRARAETGGIRGTALRVRLDTGVLTDDVPAVLGAVDGADALGDVGRDDAGWCGAEPVEQPAQATTRNSAAIPRGDTTISSSSQRREVVESARARVLAGDWQQSRRSGSDWPGGNEVATNRRRTWLAVGDAASMKTMAGARARMMALTIGCALAAGCSSSRDSDPKPRARTPSVDASQVAVQKYLDTVNKLCDDLLPKVVAVTNGGSLDIPLKDFLAQLPAHAKLRADFDRQLAQVPVPPQATTQARALSAYIKFANDLDAKRLAAAKAGQASYDKEISAEKQTAASDPTITARTAAGFNESCSAR